MNREWSLNPQLTIKYLYFVELYYEGLLLPPVASTASTIPSLLLDGSLGFSRASNPPYRQQTGSTYMASEAATRSLSYKRCY